MVELKPCPFCGGPAELKERKRGRFTDGYYSVSHWCADYKGAMSIVCVGDTIDDAAAKWNRRADDA